jgi:E3 ubiquitin-protein ligase UBR4
LLLLERMLGYLDEVGGVGGERAVPFLQVLLMLTSHMDSQEDRDRAVLDAFLTALLQQVRTSFYKPQHLGFGDVIFV